MFKDILKIVAVVIFVPSFIYGVWQVKRSFNYSFDYEDKVLQTIEAKYETRISELEKRVTELEKPKG